MEVQDMKIHLTGTVMANRKGLPDQVKPVSTRKLKKGQVVGLHNDALSVLAWKDKRVVTIFSTLYDDSVEEVIRCTKICEGVWVQEKVKNPTMICEYNKYMGDVDVPDHYATSYAFVQKTSI